MPIVKANEPIGPRPIIILYYGDPGIGKTSLFNTSNKPFLNDFDRGVDRSILRKDTLMPRDWEEVVENETKGTYKNYATIGIDTAKACLDDYLMPYVTKQDPKLKVNKLKAYGAIGDEFKLFANNRRTEQADIVTIAHSKIEDKTGRIVPDITGQSSQLLVRIADMIGFITMRNGRRVIQWDPTDETVGKNVACLPVTEIPDKGSPEFRDFNARIIEQIRAAIASQSEEQLQAVAQSEAYQNELRECGDPDCLTKILTEVNALPDYLKLPLQKLIGEKAKASGWVANKEKKCFEVPAGQAGGPPAGGVPAKDENPKEPEILPTSFDDRCLTLANNGMAMEFDQAAGFGLVFTHDQIAGWTELEFTTAVSKVNEAKKPAKPAAKKKQTAAAH